MNRICLDLLRQARSRWEGVLECHRAMGFHMIFWPSDAPHTISVRGEPRAESATDVTVAIRLLTAPRSNAVAGGEISGDICRVENAPAVLEAFLLQLGAPTTDH